MKDADKFEQAAGRLWKAGDDALDGEIRSKLNQRRQAALDTLERPARRFSYWMPAAGVAAAVAVTWVWFGNSPLINGDAPEILVSDTPEATDVEIVLADTSLDMLEELEFYVWLDEVAPDAT